MNHTPNITDTPPEPPALSTAAACKGLKIAVVTETYAPEEKNKAQGLNDLLVFATTAVTSLSAGKLLAWFGWEGVNIAVFPMVVLAVVMIIWLARHPLALAPVMPATP